MVLYNGGVLFSEDYFQRNPPLLNINIICILDLWILQCPHISSNSSVIESFILYVNRPFVCYKSECGLAEAGCHCENRQVILRRILRHTRTYERHVGRYVKLLIRIQRNYLYVLSEIYEY